MTMTPQDREFIELVAESAANRAAEKVKGEMMDAIETHHKQCEVLQENNQLKLGLKAMAAILAAGAVAGAFGSAVKNFALSTLK